MSPSSSSFSVTLILVFLFAAIVLLSLPVGFFFGARKGYSDAVESVRDGIGEEIAPDEEQK